MGAFPPPTPEVPPQIRAQMAAALGVPPGLPPMPVTMQAAQASPIPQMVDPVGMLEGKMKELELWAADFLAMCTRFAPQLKAFLPTLANLGISMQGEIAKLRERTTPPSPTLPGAETVAPAVAGTPPGLA